MAMTLYGQTFTRAYRVIWLLEELGLSYVQKRAAEHPVGTRAVVSDELAQLNPYGKLPVLVHDENVVTESLAINLYLAGVYGGALAPSTHGEWGDTYRWTIWLATEIEPLFTQRFELRFAGLSSASESARRRDAYYGRELQRRLAFLDRWLADRRYMLGDRFSVADINVSSVLEFAALADVALDEHTAISSWRMERCTSRPIWRNLRERILASAESAGHREVLR